MEELLKVMILYDHNYVEKNLSSKVYRTFLVCLNTIDNCVWPMWVNLMLKLIDLKAASGYICMFDAKIVNDQNCFVLP